MRYIVNMKTNNRWQSINQVAQDEGNTSANEAKRIRNRESAVKVAWRTIAFNEGEAACTAERVARDCELPVDYVRFVCGNAGYEVK
jgi:hypothetical protein